MKVSFNQSFTAQTSLSDIHGDGLGNGPDLKIVADQVYEPDNFMKDDDEDNVWVMFFHHPFEHGLTTVYVEHEPRVLGEGDSGSMTWYEVVAGCGCNCHDLPSTQVLTDLENCWKLRNYPKPDSGIAKDMWELSRLFILLHANYSHKTMAAPEFISEQLATFDPDNQFKVHTDDTALAVWD